MTSRHEMKLFPCLLPKSSVLFTQLCILWTSPFSRFREDISSGTEWLTGDFSEEGKKGFILLSLRMLHGVRGRDQTCLLSKWDQCTRFPASRWKLGMSSFTYILLVPSKMGFPKKRKYFLSSSVWHFFSRSRTGKPCETRIGDSRDLEHGGFLVRLSLSPRHSSFHPAIPKKWLRESNIP